MNYQWTEDGKAVKVTGVDKVAQIVGFDPKYRYQRQWLKAVDGVYTLQLYTAYQVFEKDGKPFIMFSKDNMVYLHVEEVNTYLSNIEQGKTTLELPPNAALYMLDETRDKLIKLPSDSPIDPRATYFVLVYKQNGKYDVHMVNSFLKTTFFYVEEQTADPETLNASELYNIWNQHTLRLEDLFR